MERTIYKRQSFSFLLTDIINIKSYFILTFSTFYYRTIIHILLKYNKLDGGFDDLV